MTTLNISLPDSMRTYIEEQAKNGGYSTVSEYIRTLVREDQEQKAEKRLETLLLAGLESGHAEEMTPERWNDIRQQVRKGLKKRHSRAK